MAPEFKMPPCWMVFDCESIGLHGEAFAVGYVVVSQVKRRQWAELESRLYSCHPGDAVGPPEGRAWVMQNVPDLEPRLDSPRDVRKKFWERWLYWRDRGAVLAADVAWPVEACFLEACVDDDRTLRRLEPSDGRRTIAQRFAWTEGPRATDGPYPLYDVSSMMAAAGYDPLHAWPRLGREEPAHHPTRDATQSARLLAMAIERSSCIDWRWPKGEA